MTPDLKSGGVTLSRTKIANGETWTKSLEVESAALPPSTSHALCFAGSMAHPSAGRILY
jgi:hypothetical protein